MMCDGCKLTIKVPRSGVTALGKEASGQPSPSGASFISIDEEAVNGLKVSALSLAQIETQATNTHKRHNGSSAAITLLIGERLINITKIIHIPAALRYSGSNQNFAQNIQPTFSLLWPFSVIRDELFRPG